MTIGPPDHTAARSRHALAWRISLWIVLAAVLAACETTPPPTTGGGVRLASLEILPGHDVVFSDSSQSRSLDAVAFDTNGQPYHGQVTWRSSDDSVVSVSSVGVATSVGVGSATVSVSAGGLEDSVDVTVSQPIPVTFELTEPGFAGQPFTIATMFGSATVDAASGTAVVPVSDVENTLVVATAPDGTMIITSATWRSVNAIQTQQSWNLTGLFAIHAQAAARALLLDHPMLAFGSDNAAEDDPDERRFECILDWLAFRTCQSVPVSPATTASFDALASALRAATFDMLDATVQERLLQTAVHVVDDVAAAVGVTNRDAMAVLQRMVSPAAPVSRAAAPPVVAQSYAPLASVDVDREFFHLRVKNGDRVLPELDPGVRLGVTTGGRGVDYTFRFLQVDASQHYDAADVASAVARGEGRFTAWDAETRLIPRNSVFERASIFNMAVDAVKSFFKWVGSLFGASNQDPNSVVLPNGHAYVVVGTSPGFAINRRNDVQADLARIAGLPGVGGPLGDLSANRLHNSVGLVFDVYATVTGIFGKVKKEVKNRIYQNSMECLIKKGTGYFAGDWRQDANAAGTLLRDVALCAGTAWSKENFEEFADGDDSVLLAWNAKTDALIRQVESMVAGALSESALLDSALREADAQEIEPQVIVIVPILAAVAKFVVFWEKGMAAGSALHRLGDMLVTLTPLEIAVIEIGTPNYAQRPPAVYELTVTPGGVSGNAPANGSATGTIELENTGTGSLTITNTQPNANWVTVSPTSITTLPTNGTATLTITMNATGLPSGRHDALIDINWRPATGGTTRTTTITATLTITATTITGAITTLPTGNWRVTILHPSLLDPYATSFNAIGNGAPITTNGAFNLDLSNITPPPVVLATPANPPTTTLNPPNTYGATFSLIAFNDTNNNQRLDAGETIYEINDPANTFGIGALILEYADRPYTITGTSQTSTGTTVNWNVTSAGNWGRRIDRTTAAGTEVEVTHDNRITNLQLTPGRQGTIGTAGITTLTTPTTPTPQGTFNLPHDR